MLYKRCSSPKTFPIACQLIVGFAITALTSYLRLPIVVGVNRNHAQRLLLLLLSLHLLRLVSERDRVGFEKRDQQLS
ncbi:MAG TPA: hypothetical protein VGO73_08255 [Pyrinomonadaceae bacterium]|nr:hypothetical protein [Pyrinomonadaceae bacterium]